VASRAMNRGTCLYPFVWPLRRASSRPGRIRCRPLCRVAVKDALGKSDRCLASYSHATDVKMSRPARKCDGIPMARTWPRHAKNGLALVGALLLAEPASSWEHWGGDRGGTRYSVLSQITPANVKDLIKAWEFRTGDLDRRDRETMALSKFQATPLFVDNSLIFCTPFNEVIALDPGTGAQKWRFDPRISTKQRPADRYNCRGVAYWENTELARNATCRARICIHRVRQSVAHRARRSQPSRLGAADLQSAATVSTGSQSSSTFRDRQILP
jgi:glucose dehydrogenase